MNEAVWLENNDLEELSNTPNSKLKDKQALNQWWWVGIVFKQDDIYTVGHKENWMVTTVNKDSLPTWSLLK